MEVRERIRIPIRRTQSFYNIQLNLYKICDTFTEDD